jgi:hypothetical protein
MGGNIADTASQQQGLRVEQLRERREHRKTERRRGGEPPRLCEGPGKGQVVHGLVEAGRWVEREDEERRDREQAEGNPPTRHTAQIRKGRAPGPETSAVDRYDHCNQDAGPQQAERAEQKAEMSQNGEPERDSHGEPLRPAFPGETPRDQRAGRPRAGGQDGQSQRAQ